METARGKGLSPDDRVEWEELNGRGESQTLTCAERREQSQERKPSDQNHDWKRIGRRGILDTVRAPGKKAHLSQTEPLRKSKEKVLS